MRIDKIEVILIQAPPRELFTDRGCRDASGCAVVTRICPLIGI